MDMKQLYSEVVRHYQSCQLEMSNISDTWDHTISQKGAVHSYDEMINMFVAGNRVNSWIDDCVYLIDQSVLDAADPITRELLQMGESDFGSPAKDIFVEGAHYSSNFIHTVVLAVPIIRRIKQNNLTHPRILEIGGGVGLLQYLLMVYFKGNLTYYSCDIPETLLIQEWFVRNSFPQVATTFTGGVGQVVDYSGVGVHFINAYFLKKLCFTFDCAINIDSMQEMYASTVQDYIQFIQHNISDNGFFFFQNHYGHSAHGVSEASEYELGSRWRIHSVEFSPQIANCDESEQMRVIFDRTVQEFDPVKRRQALRLIWSGFVLNHLHNCSPETALLIECANGCSTRWEQVCEQFKQNTPPFHPALEFSSNAPVPIKMPFWQSCAQSLPTAATSLPDYQYLDLCIRACQARLLTFLATMPDMTDEAICSSREKIKDTLKQDVSPVHLSAYWSAYLAGIFFALGDASHAISLLVVARDSTCSPYWHIRFAQLCSRFGQQAAGVECLHGLKDVGRLDFYNRLQLCELTFIHNDRNVAWAMLERLIAEAFTDTAKAISLARTAGLLERYDCMHEAIGRVVMEEGLSGKVLELLLLYGTVPEIKDYSDVLLESHSAGISLQSQLYLILLQSGRTGREVVKSLLQHDNIAEYYALAGAGRLLLRAGLPDEAECCFQKSVALRPNAFLHLEFIGNIYFEQGMFKNAARYLQQVIATKSYLRHVWARYLYACLPKNYQQNKFSIVAQNVEILFQRKQDFYHQSGPTSK